MTLQKFGTGKVLKEETEAIDKSAAATKWSKQDAKDLREENQK